MTSEVVSQPLKHLSHPKYRADIDGLRAVAVLAVVAFHAAPYWVHGGFIGVDIFFVISGFLISSIIFDSLERNRFSFAEFYARRINRIFPALLLVLLSCLVFGWFVLLPPDYKRLGKHVAGSAGFVANFVLWSENNYFNNVREGKPLLHIWSLGVEEQFYIFWPLLLWVAWKRRLNLLTLTAGLATVSFILNVWSIHRDIVGTFFAPQTRFWELSAGSTLAYIKLYRQETFSRSRRGLDRWLGALVYARAPESNGDMLRSFQSVLGAGLIAAGIVWITAESSFPGWWALLPVCGAVLIISAGPHAWFNRMVLSRRMLVWFGLISYPLYLWHWPLLAFTRVLQDDKPSPKMRIAAVCASIALAWLTFRLVERPIRFGIRSRAKPVVLFILMAAVGCVGYDCYERSGLGFRYPKAIRSLVEYRGDIKEDPQYGSCFLDIGQDYSDFERCETPIENGKPAIFIWGDSHAERLYPGFQASYSQTFNVILRTAAACPPILNLEARPNCKELNDHIFEFIRTHKPDDVVLDGNWGEYDWRKLGDTIAELRRIGIKTIEVVGPAPSWNSFLPQEIYLYYKSHPSEKIPDRMNFGLSPNFGELDFEMAEFARHRGVTYISPKKIMCNEDGCMTRIGDIPTTGDYGHLTNEASRFLVSKFPKQ